MPSPSDGLRVLAGQELFKGSNREERGLLGFWRRLVCASLGKIIRRRAERSAASVLPHIFAYGTQVMRATQFACCLVLLGAFSAVGHAADWGLKEGTPDFKSVGPLAFGPDGVLLIGDPQAAAVFAIDTGDSSGDPSQSSVNVKGLNAKAAELLGVETAQIKVNDLAVNPLSGNVYLSLTAGDSPALLRVGPGGEVSQVSLAKIPFARVTLPDAPEDRVTGEGRRRRNKRNYCITDLAFFEGKILVSGLSNAEAPSTIRELAFPLIEADQGTSVEIFHGAHGRFEDSAPIQTFLPFIIDGQPNLLAGYVCTPLVKFPVKQLGQGNKVRGTTVAELGNRNRPLDMIVYEKDGKNFLLMANSARGVMKISTDKIEREEGITERIRGTAGQPYETIEELQGVVQLDRLNDKHAVILVQTNSSQDLQTIPLP